MRCCNWILSLCSSWPKSLISESRSYLRVFSKTNGVDRDRRGAPTGPVAALRETSVLFGTAFAAWMLAERVGRIEWLSAVIAVIGIALLRLG